MWAGLPLAIFASTLGPSAPPPEGAPAVQLVPGGRTEWLLAPGEVRRHVVTLRAGEFLRVTIEQAGLNVSLHLHDPRGEAGPVIDGNDTLRGWEPASILAAEAGDHTIEVRAQPGAPGPGRYVVDTDAARPAEARDHRRLEAEAARALAAPGLPPGIYSGRGAPSSDAIHESLRQLALVAEISRELGETCWEAEATTLQALLRSWANQHPMVRELHDRGLGLWERCGDRYGYAEAHIYSAEGFMRAAQYPRAVEAYERGLAIAREIGAEDLELLLLTNLGAAHSRVGDPDRAQDCTERALPLLRARQLPQGEAVALRNLALGHLRRGDYEQAVQRALESLAVRRRIGDRPGEAATLITLAESYLELGETAAAQRYLDEALDLSARGFTNPATAPRILSTLARVHEQSGDRAGALDLLERALALQQRHRHRESEPESLLSIGRLHLGDRAWEPAWEAGLRAVELSRDAGHRFGLANALELLGAAALGLGDLAGAQASLEECLALRRLVQDTPGEATALHYLARVDRSRGDAASARQRLEEALRLVEKQRARIFSPDLRATWLATVREIHETYVDVLMDLHRRDAGAGWDARAFKASEAARARSLLDLISEARSEVIHGVEPGLLARERVLRERLGARLERQIRVLSQEGHGDKDALARDLRELATEYEEVRGRIRATSPRYQALTDPESLGLEKVRSRVLDAETLLLEYSLGPERSRLWLVGLDEFAAFELPGRTVIEETVRQVREAVGRRSSGDGGRKALESLSRLLLGPALDRLRHRRLLFVADGALHHVPFAALPDGQGRALVSTHEVVSAPSASVLALLREGAGERPAPTRAVAVLADPVFERSDERVRAAQADGPGTNPVLVRATRDFGFDQGRLPRLPFTRREARSILALAPAGSSRLALDFEASRATVNDTDLRRYRVVHFATHGLLNDVRPELSGLVLSLVDADGRDTPGLLTAPDVLNLELGAELVVLSGCRTGLGKEIRGEGLVGLTRAFMYAGVPRVVASLWPVDDLATAELMKRFYEGMLGPRKLRAAAALREAQAQMARHRRWSAPYYWAGFALHGDWR